MINLYKLTLQTVGALVRNNSNHNLTREKIVFSKALSIKSILLGSFLISASITSANATVYSNAQDTPTFYNNPEIVNFGQEFTTAGGTLTNWSFYAIAGLMGNINLVISSWDGSKAVGPALYTSTTFYGGGAQTLSFSGINLQLSSGSYISYLTGAGVPDRTGGLFLGASYDDGGLLGSFRFFEPGITDWRTSSVSNFNLQYTAVINPVPEPENLALLLTGLGLISMRTHRNRKA